MIKKKQRREDGQYRNVTADFDKAALFWVDPGIAVFLMKEKIMKTTLTACAFALSLIASGGFTVANAQGAAQQSQQSQRSSVQAQHSQRPSVRAEVKSDLADWRAAGFDDHSYDVLSRDVFGAEYQQRYAKYQQLHQLHGYRNAVN